MFLGKKSSSLDNKSKESSSNSAETEDKSPVSGRTSLSSKLRVSFSFKKKEGSSTPAGSTGAPVSNGRSTSLPPPSSRDTHPYENIDSLPDRRRAASTRKSVGWKDPETGNLDDILRARAKSVKDRDGRRTSLSWTSNAPLSSTNSGQS